MDQEKIHDKGFDMIDNDRLNYGKIKAGTKNLDDAIIELGSLKKVHRNFGSKHFVLKALHEKNIPVLREISNFFYDTNGIYSRMCNNFANLYRYDWFIEPKITDSSVKSEKVLKEFNTILNYLDHTHINLMCSKIALKVVRDGAYYGYKVPTKDRLLIQELPINFCRSRYTCNGYPVVEFNMRYFDMMFGDLNYRMRVLKMFPLDIQKGYVLYKQNKIPKDFRDDINGWYALDPTQTIRINLLDSDAPLFVNAVPALLDLDAAQDLDRRKALQQLLKIVIQKLPIDKNGDLVFDVDEARDIHNNAVEMLSRAIGVDVLTTFADVSVEDMADSNTTTTTDDLEKIERTVFNEFGTTSNIYNSEGNIATNYSILNDEATIRTLLLQFEVFFEGVVEELCSNKKKYYFDFNMLETTWSNYKDLSKMYKEQVTIGFSKILPQVALGHSQSSIINNAYFENEILSLSEIMVPPMQSSTMNAESIQTLKRGKAGSENEAGRPEKEDTEKSEKTIANKESMS